MNKISIIIFIVFVALVGYFLGSKKINTVTRTIEIMVEAENCKAWNGEMQIHRGFNGVRISCEKDYTDGNKQINETLFEYFFDY